MRARLESLVRSPRAAGAAALAIALGLVGWAAVTRARFLFASPYPLGIDGYFYPIQLRALLDGGHLYYPSSPLVLWLMAPLAAVTDPITGAKLGAALGTAAVALPVYFVGRRVSGDRAIGVLAAVLAATSASSFYLSVEFVKSGIGMTFAAVYLALLGSAVARPTRARIAAAALSLVAAFAAHKLAGALALMSTPAPLWVAWRARGGRLSLTDRRLRLALLAAAVAIAALVAAGLLAPTRFPGLRDVALLGDLFTGSPDFTIPALDLGRGPALRFGLEAPIAGALALAAAGLLVAGRRWPAIAGDLPARDRALVVGPAAFALLAVCPWLDAADPQGLAFRLRVVLFVPLAVCAAFVAGRALARATPLVRGALVIGFACGWIVSRPPTSTEGTVTEQPHMVAAMMAARGVVPDGDVVICPQRSLVFMYTWYTGRPARTRPEPVPHDHRWRLLPSRLIHRELHAALDRMRAERPPGLTLPRGLHPRHRNGVVLVPEASWDWLMAHVSPPVRAIYQRWQTI